MTEDDRSRPLLVAREWHATGSAAAGRHSAEFTAIERWLWPLSAATTSGVVDESVDYSWAATTSRRQSSDLGKEPSAVRVRWGVDHVSDAVRAMSARSGIPDLA